MASRAKVKLKVKTAPNAAQLLSVGMPSGRLTLKVGFLGDATAARSDEMTNPRLAAIHEFGAPEANIPERPFMGPSWDKHFQKYRQELRALVARAGKSPTAMEQGLNLLGARMVADVRDFIVGGAPIAPENAPAVKRRKERKSSGAPGGVRTLVDTGQLVRSIAWVVERS